MKNKGFTLVEVLVVVAILGLLAAVGIPALLNARQGADTKIMEINVSTVNAAKEQWAIINNKAPGSSVVWANIEDYIGAGIDTLDDFDIGGVSLTIKRGINLTQVEV